MTSLYSDHSDLTSLTDVVQDNSFQTNTSRFGLTQSFWSTPQRASTDDTSDVLDITLSASCRINWIQFDLAKFPHMIVVQQYDDTLGWLPLSEVGGAVVERSVLTSSPGILPPPSSVTGHQNPQHSFVGHWQTEQIALLPVQVTRLRLILTRLPNPNAPVDIYGNYTNYSLAVRNLSFGYQVASASDVPVTLSDQLSIDNGSYGTTFASADDVLGSNIDFRVRTLDASRTVLDNAEDATWRCEPQPDPSCVVNLYADVRTADLQAQVVDRIFLDPVNNGAHVTVYFSNDIAIGDFVSGDQPLVSDQIDATPNVLVDTDGMHFSLAGVYPGTDSLIIDNQDLKFRPDQPWWVGLVTTPSFTPPGTPTIPSTTNAVILDCGVWQLAWTDTGLAVVFSTGDRIDLSLLYQALVQTTIFVSYDGTNYQLWASNVIDTESITIAVTIVLDENSINFIALGSDLTRTYFGQSDIAELVIKEEQPPVDGTSYAADPHSFAEVDEYAADEPATSHLNSILRFDPTTSLVSNAFPWCLFGGGQSRYENMIWTPIPREYTCQRGWLKLPPAKAKYWKLEFTHLQASYADVYVPVQQLVRYFPASVLAAYRQQIEQGNSPTDAADDTQSDVAGYTAYLDTPSVVSTGGTGQGYTSTQVYVADDTNMADRLYASQGENWNYQSFLSPLSAPRFATTQTHVYQTQLVTRTSKVAYSVGVRNLKFARSVTATTYDTPQYQDEFFDTTNLDETQTSWVYDEDQFALTSGLSDTAQIFSQVMQSNRKVRAVQFAAQQSPPSQVLPDTNFDDAHHADWIGVGDAQIENGVSSTAFGQLIPVVRSLPDGYWEDIAPEYGTWGAIQAADVTWGDLEAGNGASANDPAGNGIASGTPLAMPQGGYAYAAARVWTDRDLFAPLWLQIIDSITGEVLNEESVLPRKGQITEWYIAYELGTDTTPGAQTTWGQLEGDQSEQTFLDHFTRGNQTGLGSLDSGQTWLVGESWNGTENTPLNIAGNVGTVAATGARSAIDVGTPWGSLIVQLGTLIKPTTPVELIDIGGLVLRTDGHLIDPNTGYSYASLTIAAADDLQFDFMPTSQVPSGHSSGADASIRSWSVSITRNGTFVTTISTATPFSTVRVLAGSTGQTFTSFEWIPVDITIPTDTEVFCLPVPRDGSLNTAGTVWTQASDGRAWSLTGSFTRIADSTGIVQSLQAPSGLSFDFDTDVGDLYGAMTFQVTVSGTTAAANYYVAKLDIGSQSGLYLRADGALVQVTPALGTVILKTGAVPSFSSQTTVLFLLTANLSSAFRSTYSLSPSYVQTLVFLNGTTVVGTYQGNSLFVNTTRGVMGTDGSVISGFEWGPDLGAINTGSGLRTWQEVSGGGALTWADVIGSSGTVVDDPVTVRVVQKEASADLWYMDALALYVDPIVWEFSNDGGATYTAASTIRNNPRAVMLFDPTSTSAANNLCYRVTAYAPNAWLAHLVIRPWYVGFMRDAPVLPNSPDGPNLNPYDNYVPVEQDPSFMAWSVPIPREFFFAFRSILPDITPQRVRDPFTSERILAP